MIYNSLLGQLTMDNDTILIRAHPDEIIEMSDGIVIQQNDMLHTLNITAIEILELCDGKLSVLDIMREMQARYPENDIEIPIKNFLEKLSESGLVEIKS